MEFFKIDGVADNLISAEYDCVCNAKPLKFLFCKIDPNPVVRQTQGAVRNTSQTQIYVK